MRFRRTFLALCGALAFTGAFTACATDGGETEEDGNTTSGKRVALSTVVAPGPLTFVNDEGWSVTVTKAVLSIGPLYYFDGEPIEGATEARLAPPVRRAPGLFEVFGELIVGTAHAHPGHYLEGEARGEVLESTSVDLAVGSTPIADGKGVSGLVRSARFSWATSPTGPLAGELTAGGRSLVAIVVVRAEKDGETRHARFEGTPDDVLDADGLPQVDGCVFDEVDLQGDGAVTVTVNPEVWLAGSDFTELTEGAADAPVLVPVGTQPANAFSRGLKKGGAYRFSFAAGG